MPPPIHNNCPSALNLLRLQTSHFVLSPLFLRYLANCPRLQIWPLSYHYNPQTKPYNTHIPQTLLHQLQKRQLTFFSLAIYSSLDAVLHFLNKSITTASKKKIIPLGLQERAEYLFSNGIYSLIKSHNPNRLHSSQSNNFNKSKTWIPKQTSS